MQGALMVGHNCGGLGKMPGFYFRAELDNVQDMAHRRGPPMRLLEMFTFKPYPNPAALPGAASGASVIAEHEAAFLGRCQAMLRTRYCTAGSRLCRF